MSDTDISNVNLSNEIEEPETDEIFIDQPNPGSENDESNATLPESPEDGDSMTNFSIKKELDEIVQDFKKMTNLPDVVAELIMKKKLNTMIVDLYDYEKGYAISFHKFGDDEEIFHGQYSYGVSIIDYIKDGEIPYELFDLLCNYKFQLYYDGYVLCKLRINFKLEDSMRTHFILLNHTIQTIDGECAMNCQKDKSLDFRTERARLIKHYSPDLCLDPDPVVSDIIFSNELNQYPFITPNLKDIILKEKARREKGVKEKFKNSASWSEPDAPTEPKKENNWSFRLTDPTAEEVELSKLEANMASKSYILPYLKQRKMCFPDKDSFTGFHVEIENFVYEYDGLTRAKTVESIQDQFCIGVLDDKEFYYGAYKLDDRMKGFVPFYWWEIGNRELLDIHVNTISQLEFRYMCHGGMKITHNRLFDEHVEFSDGEIRIDRYKLDNPVSQVILPNPLPTSKDKNEQEKKN